MYISKQRQRILDRAIDVACTSASKKLNDACRTQWIEHIDSYIVFLELVPAVCMTIQAMVYHSGFQNLGWRNANKRHRFSWSLLHSWFVSRFPYHASGA